MNQAYEKLVQHLDGQRIHYLADSGNCCISADFRGEVGSYRIVAKVIEDAALFQVRGYCPMRIPQGAREAVSEAITRANDGLRLGKFEMTLDDGELRFQAAQILTAFGLDDEVIGRLIRAALLMLDRYLPAVLSVIYGNEQPKDAIRHAEAK